MSLNESIVEDADLELFGEQCRVAPTLIPAFSHREKGKEREPVQRLNPANACGNPHPASPTGRGEPGRCTQTGGQPLQILQQFKPEWR
jgi:hypothetical protein